MYVCATIGDSKPFMNNEGDNLPRSTFVEHTPVAFYI